MKTILVLLVMLSTAATADETITTRDGRVVVLKDNGTYEIQAENKAKWQDYVALEKALFRKTERNYSQVIDYMPNFRNVSDKTIIGIEFLTDFRNVFDKSVKKLKGTVEERIAPSKNSKNKLFYAFKDNQFMTGETYDKLLPLVTVKTGKQEVTVTTIVFEDGQVMKF